MKVLLTGATGFIGSKIAEEQLALGNEVLSLERINPRNTLGVFRSSVKPIYHDFQAPLPARLIAKLDDVECIIHCGAEVHGLRSLENPELFVRANVLGTFNLLEAARSLKKLQRFVYVSSAEVLGSCPIPYSADESTSLRPSNPYAGAKASGELLCRSYRESFNVPTLVVRTMNVFGERQDISKFVPATIKKILAGELVTIHIGPDGNSGSRQWIYVEDCANAISYLSHCGNRGEIYHITGPEKTNQEMVGHIARFLHTPLRQNLIVPGNSHDTRYNVADNKLGPDIYNDTEEKMLSSLEQTVLAYQNNRGWLL